MTKTSIFMILTVCLLTVICYSGYQIWNIEAQYQEEASIHRTVMEYKPVTEWKQNGTQKNATEIVVYQSVMALQEEYLDAVGWLTVPNTKIDYPFMWYKDNDYYLNRDINGNDALAGTLFMDYRCETDFTSQNTVIYGHHMKNDSMFGTLKAFDDQAFFDENKHGTIYLSHAILTLEIFAYMVVDPATEREIYNIELSETFFDYVKQNARHFRDLGLTDRDKIVTLSTCAYEFDNARMVLLAKSS